MARLMTAALVTAIALGAGAAQAAAEPVILSTGHTDALDVRAYENGSLRVDVRDDTAEPTVYRDPADVIFHAKPESALPIPEGLPPGYAFLGEPGDTIWYLPQTQDPNLLWPGWETTRLRPGMFVDDQVEFRLLEVDGPGQFHLWFTDAIGQPLVQFTTSDGLPDTMSVGITHAHADWAFTAPGLYTLFFEVTGTLVGGGPVTSGVVRYRFFVGDLADLPALPETALAITGLEESYDEGETATLAAVQAPDTGLADYRWSARCGDAPGYTAAGSGASLSFAAEDGCRYRVKLYGSGGALIATSHPVTVNVRRPPDPPPAGGQQPPPTGETPQPPPAPDVTPPDLTLSASSARLRGRTLSLRIRLSERGRVTVRVRKGGRTVAKAKARDVPPGRRVLRVRLSRRLAAGRYTVVVRAREGSRLVERTVALRA
jgi:surface-anchored protein